MQQNRRPVTGFGEPGECKGRSLGASRHEKTHPLWGWARGALGMELNAEGRTTTAGRLDLGVLKLETCSLKGLDVINGAAIQIHQ